MSLQTSTRNLKGGEVRRGPGRDTGGDRSGRSKVIRRRDQALCLLGSQRTGLGPDRRGSDDRSWGVSPTRPSAGTQVPPDSTGTGNPGAYVPTPPSRTSFSVHSTGGGRRGGRLPSDGLVSDLGPFPDLTGDPAVKDFDGGVGREDSTTHPLREVGGLGVLLWPGEGSSRLPRQREDSGRLEPVPGQGGGLGPSTVGGGWEEEGARHRVASGAQVFGGRAPPGGESGV